MGWIVFFLIVYVVVYNIREEEKKEKHRLEDEEIMRRNEKIEKQAIIDWNNGVCPDCGVEWVLNLAKNWELKEIKNLDQIHLEHLCYCPKCNKKLYHVPDFVNYEEKWDAYHATASDIKHNDRRKELNNTREQAKNRRNKMF